VRIQRDNIRNMLRKIYGVQGSPGPEVISDDVQVVVDVLRRTEFELLKEQGIFAWQAFRARTPAAGQNAHCYCMTGSNQGNVPGHTIVERVEFSGASAGTIQAQAGTQLGASNSAIVSARDARWSRDWLTDFSSLVTVQDGETAVVPPAVGVPIWQGKTALNGPQLVWTGPVLLRHFSETPVNTPDQLAFQMGVAAARIEYTFYGYFIPLAGS